MPELTSTMCPESVTGTHGLSDVAGRCLLCRRQIDPPAPRPRGVPRSELSEAYAYHYDPDWGASDA